LFCTPAYVEMQRGRCLLWLGRPASAVAALEDAVRALPPVYRRDRGVALSALDVARDAGSERIVSMVITVAAALAPYRHLEAVAGLHEALAETRGA
jgi:hypothetical protein